ncbi:MAG: hypothetical protein H6706_18120 [Myxococcales bacterium]|nr:hypothetical protein [Myxococcales bacterium]
MGAEVKTGLGVAALLGVVPLLVAAMGHLGGRDYVAGGLLIFAAAAVGHLGLELVALGTPATARDPDDEEDW